MKSAEIRRRYIDYFVSKKHAEIPSAPLLPENDPSVLFNTAGMQPLVPYLLGESHPLGKRLVNSQKCVRTNDIDEVGDNTHLTFFEMLGNWSLGDYFKKEQIAWIWEFLTDKEIGLGLDPSRLYVTIFAGNDDAPFDQEAKDIWLDFVPEHRIFQTVDDNWWSAGDNGPCGPDSEIFYDVTGNLGDVTAEEFFAADERQDVVEICNNVFMQYLKEDGVVTGELKNKNIDFGSGLERLTMIMQECSSPFETDMFESVMRILNEKGEQKYCEKNSQSYRVIADHIRSATFMIADGAHPSNKDAGYVLRRLLRRSAIKMKEIGFDPSYTDMLVASFVSVYEQAYPELVEKKNQINDEISKEIEKFAKTIEHGLKAFEKIVDQKNTIDNITVQQFGVIENSHVNEISGAEVFNLFTTYGFPIELIEEEAQKRNIFVDKKGFELLLKEHQDSSRSASAGKFKGGLGGDSPKITAFHTATHLLLAGLRKELGDHVNQAGSNITEERTRFDFTHPEKVDRETLDRVESYVNAASDARASIEIVEMKKGEAKDAGVVGSFWEKYPDVVKVYQITDENGTVWSRELCGGPHVENTQMISDFGKFKIKKESSSSAGVRRIKAVFEK